MSNIPIKDANETSRNVDTFTRTEGADTVETQAVAVVNPANGTPVDFATQTTLTALLAATNALKDATEALNAKTTAVNTGAIAGEVYVSNMGQQPLTNSQLRDNPVTVEDTTVSAYLYAVNGNVSAISNRVGSVEGATLADLQASIQTLSDTMLYMLTAMLEKMPRLDSADRMITRVVVSGENDLNSAYGGVFLNGVGDPVSGRVVYRTMEPWNFSDAGSARIYQQIQVTA